MNEELAGVVDFVKDMRAAQDMWLSLVWWRHGDVMMTSWCSFALILFVLATKEAGNMNESSFVWIPLRISGVIAHRVMIRTLLGWWKPHAVCVWCWINDDSNNKLQQFESTGVDTKAAAVRERLERTTECAYSESAPHGDYGGSWWFWCNTTRIRDANRTPLCTGNSNHWTSDSHALEYLNSTHGSGNVGFRFLNESPLTGGIRIPPNLACF